MLLTLCMGCKNGKDHGMRRFVRLAMGRIGEVPVGRKEESVEEVNVHGK